MSERELVEIKPGDTVVDYDRQWGNIKVHAAIAVKPKTYTYFCKWGWKQDDGSPAGEESSIGQRTHAIRQAEQQMRDRNKRLIAEANGTPIHPETGEG